MKKILLIEDDELFTDLLVNLLTNHNYEVDIAATIASAVDTLNHQSIDLIISDYYLPDGNILEMIEQHKSFFDDAQLIVLSGKELNADDFIAHKLNVTYLSKRESFEQIIAVINNLKDNQSDNISDNLAPVQVKHFDNLERLIQLKNDVTFIKHDFLEPLEQLNNQLEDNHFDANFIHHKITIGRIINADEFCELLIILEDQVRKNQIDMNHVKRVIKESTAVLKNLTNYLHEKSHHVNHQ